jgi:hypothetical protein
VVSVRVCNEAELSVASSSRLHPKPLVGMGGGQACKRGIEEVKMWIVREAQEPVLDCSG